MEALLIVDVQNDFCPGGALPAPEGDKIIRLINKLMEQFPVVVASRDWHPPQTVHFRKWPVHCVQGSKGADFHPDLNITRINKEFLKGTGDKDDGYSSFEATNANLAEFLRQIRVDDVYITGLTTEYCVKNTALDSILNGFKTCVLTDAIAPVEPDSENEKRALADMKNAGIVLLTTKDLVHKENC